MPSRNKPSLVSTPWQPYHWQLLLCCCWRCLLSILLLETMREKFGATAIWTARAKILHAFSTNSSRSPNMMSSSPSLKQFGRPIQCLATPSSRLAVHEKTRVLWECLYPSLQEQSRSKDRTTPARYFALSAASEGRHRNAPCHYTVTGCSHRRALRAGIWITLDYMTESDW